MHQVIRVALHSLFRHFKTLNLFKDAHTTYDEHRRRTQIVSSRIFIIMLLIIICILATYNGLRIQTQTVTVQEPSLSVCEQLQAKYGSTIECPCQNISVPVSSTNILFYASLLSVHRKVNTSQLYHRFTQYAPVSLCRLPGNQLYTVARELCIKPIETIALRLYLTSNFLPCSVS